MSTNPAKRWLAFGVLTPLVLVALPQLGFKFIPGCRGMEVAVGCKALGLDFSSLFTILAYGSVFLVPMAFVNVLVTVLIWNANRVRHD